MRPSRIDPGALFASALAHCLLVASGAVLWSSRDAADRRAELVEVTVDSTLPVRGSGRQAPLGRTGADPVPAPNAEEAPQAKAGGRTVARPDTRQEGRGGQRLGARATNLASSVDPVTLERDVPNHLAESEVQRLRTARLRRTLDDRRATPHPMELDFVASGRGRVAMRRPASPTEPRNGVAWTSVPVARGNAPGVAVSADTGLASAGDAAQGVTLASRATGDVTPAAAIKGAKSAPTTGVPLPSSGVEARVSAAVITARPLVPATRPAVPVNDRGITSDLIDSRQKVASRVAALLQASTLGGDAETGTGGEAAPAAPAIGKGSSWGARSEASGYGSGTGETSEDPAVHGYYRKVLSQLDRVLRNTFPNWAIAEGRGGLVVFDLALSGDGRIAGIAVVRPSGVDEYDRNVVHALRRAGTFGPIPQAIGRGTVLRISWDSRNPAVGRSGPGPGRVAN